MYPQNIDSLAYVATTIPFSRPLIEIILAYCPEHAKRKEDSSAVKNSIDCLDLAKAAIFERLS
jgi:hypothetical protein